MVKKFVKIWINSLGIDCWWARYFLQILSRKTNLILIINNNLIISHELNRSIHLKQGNFLHRINSLYSHNSCQNTYSIFLLSGPFFWARKTSIDLSRPFTSAKSFANSILPTKIESSNSSKSTSQAAWMVKADLQSL